eukprot:gene5728-4089_t
MSSATLFSSRVHPFLFAALQDDQHTGTAPTRPASTQKKTVASFQRAFSHTLWVLLTAPDAQDVDAVPPRLPIETVLQHLERWSSAVVGSPKPAAGAASSPKDATEPLYVQVVSEILFHTSRHRRMHAESNGAAAGKHSLPSSVASVAQAIPAAIFSLRRRCLLDPAPHSLPPPSPSAGVLHRAEAEAAAPVARVRALLQQLWFHYLLVFSQQLMAAFSGPENEAWHQFTVSCVAEAKSFVASASTFSDSDDDDDDADNDDGLEEAEPNAVLEALAPPSLPAESTGLVEDSAMDRALRREGVKAWGRLPPKFFVEALAKARSKRVVLLSRSCTPHHILQAPEATFSMVQVFEDYRRQWNSLIRRLPRGALTPARRRQFFPRFAREKEASGLEPAESGQDAAPSLESGGDAAAEEEVLRALSALPLHFSAKLGELVGEARLHAFLVVSALVSVMASHYVLPQRSRKGGAGGSACAPPPVPPGKAAQLADLVRYREKIVSWISQSATVSYRPLEDPCDEVEWQWRQYCPWGLLLQSPGALPLQPFLSAHVFHLLTSKLLLGLTPTAHLEGRQKMALVSLLCGVTDVPKSLLLYHLAYAPPPAPAAVHTGTAAPPLSLPTTALAGLTKAMNAAARGADSRLVFDISAGSQGGQQQPALRPQRGFGAMRRSRASLTATSAADHLRSEGVEMEEEEEEDNEEGFLEGEPVLVEGQLHGKQYHEMTFAVPLPSLTAFVSDASAAAGPRPVFLAPSASQEAHNPESIRRLTEALSTVSPVSFAIDLALSRFLSLTGEVLHYLHHRLLLPQRPAVPSPQRESVTSDASSGTEGLKGAATSSIEAVAQAPVNLFLVPRRLMPVGVHLPAALLIMTSEWLGRWEAEDQQADRSTDPRWWTRCGAQQVRVLRQLLPLLTEAGSCMASPPFLHQLLRRLTVLCRCAWSLVGEQHSQKHLNCRYEGVARDVFGIAEAAAVRVVMPSFRLMEPNPALYDALYALFHVWEEATVMGGALFGARGVEFLHISEWMRYEDITMALAVERRKRIAVQLSRPTRHPLDLLQCKDQQALFQQCFRRVNLLNARVFHRQLLHVFYSQPVFAVERLLQQAVGYRNDFLDVHLQLVAGVPPAVITILLHRGLDLLQAAAHDELAVGSDLQRTISLSRFLATVSRAQHQQTTTHLRLLLRSIEHALRRYSRETHLYALELLKAIFYEYLGSGLSHEEQYSATQRQALAAAAVSQFFGSGRAESFRRTRWDTGLPYTPLQLYAAKQALRRVLCEPCHVPLAAGDGEAADEDAGVVDMFDMEEKELREVRWVGGSRGSPSAPPLSLGQQLLLHLRTWRGKLEQILVTNAKESDTVIDLIFTTAALLQDASTGAVQQEGASHSTDCVSLLPEQLLEEAAIPHVARRLSGAAMQRAVPPALLPFPMDSAAEWAPDDALDAVQDQLTLFHAQHLWYNAAPYEVALKELEAFQTYARQQKRSRALLSDDRATASAAASPIAFTPLPGAPVSTQEVALLLWCRQRIEAEQQQHRELFEASAAARDHLVAMTRRVLCGGADPVLLATEILVPRLLLSMEDEMLVEAFIERLWAESCGDAAFRAAVVALSFSMVTCLLTFFMGFSSSECRRVGFFVASVLSVVRQYGGVSSVLLGTADRPGVMEETAAEILETRIHLFLTAHQSAVQHQLVAGGNKDPAGPHHVPPGAGESREGGTDFLTFLLMGSHKQLGAPNAPEKDQTMFPAGQFIMRLAPAREQPTPSGTSEHQPRGVHTTAVCSSALPAYPTQLEVYLCHAIVSLLTSPRALPVTQRNVLLVLERLPLDVFPSTVVCIEHLLRGLKPHMAKTNPNAPSATAAVKRLLRHLQHFKESQAAVNQYLLGQIMRLRPSAPADAAQVPGAATGSLVEAWYRANLRLEAFARDLLSKEIRAEKASTAAAGDAAAHGGGEREGDDAGAAGEPASGVDAGVVEEEEVDHAALLASLEAEDGEPSVTDAGRKRRRSGSREAWEEEGEGDCASSAGRSGEEEEGESKSDSDASDGSEEFEEADESSGGSLSRSDQDEKDEEDGDREASLSSDGSRVGRKRSRSQSGRRSEEKRVDDLDIDDWRGGRRLIFIT